jgi:hypothetical protein
LLSLWQFEQHITLVLFPALFIFIAYSLNYELFFNCTSFVE